ncbi:MAG: alpha/beta hydrolase [Paludibacterium sp.]|uniref:RBBP9/YdeN family alpha/beta hydrolase n=1 Tax=Paludibacterium sp. TaxID=1917523 RepID=UPI0025CBFBB0|nr:alpha/beta hydrolase [Paludibacterium sp.]MBV8045841.1 alpha/beta hydrolase [Paludibacterium sp.]MBV8648559.1 alpha/beta hydrolase [Paludibacterium sp.]
MVALVIVPGWQDSGPLHWQTLWEKTFPGCLRVEQHDWMHPRRADWVRALAETVAQADDDVVLAAHSLGCSTVAHWAASLSLSAQRRVKGALLVAPPDVRGAAFAADVPAEGFGDEPDWRLPFPAIVVASSNDPYCAIECAQTLSDRWGASFVDIGPAGHINADSRLGQWEAGQRLLQRLILGD